MTAFRMSVILLTCITALTVPSTYVWSQSSPCPTFSFDGIALRFDLPDPQLNVSIETTIEAQNLRMLVAASAEDGGTYSTVVALRKGFFSWQTVQTPYKDTSREEFYGGELYAVVGLLNPLDAPPTLVIVREPQANIPNSATFTREWSDFSIMTINLNPQSLGESIATCTIESDYPGATTTVGASWFAPLREFIQTRRGERPFRSQTPQNIAYSGCETKSLPVCSLPIISGGLPFRPQNLLHSSLLDEPSARQLFASLRGFLVRASYFDIKVGRPEPYRRVVSVARFKYSQHSKSFDQLINGSVYLGKDWEIDVRNRITSLLRLGSRTRGKASKRIFDRLLRLMALISEAPNSSDPSTKNTLNQ